MEFKFSKQEEKFRTEVENFQKEELPTDWPDKSMHWPGGYGSIEIENKENQRIFLE